MELNKENLLSFYELKRKIIQEFLDKANNREDVLIWNSKLSLIDSLIEELNYFE